MRNTTFPNSAPLPLVSTLDSDSGKRPNQSTKIKKAPVLGPPIFIYVVFGSFPGGEDRAIIQGQYFWFFCFFQTNGNVVYLRVAIRNGVGSIFLGPFKIGIKN